jgi:HPt (histidine-containing phosphotransfer) domain-containing protein
MMYPVLANPFNFVLPLDWSRVEMVAESVEEKRALLELFFRMANSFADAMGSALDNSDLAGWRQTAHSLKGSAANLGMACLEELCRQAEDNPIVTCAQQADLLERIRTELMRARNHILSQNRSLLGPEV